MIEALPLTGLGEHYLFRLFLAIGLCAAMSAAVLADPTPTPKSMMKSHSMSSGSMKKSSMKSDSMKKSSMKSDSMKGNSMKGDSMKGNSMKGDSMKKAAPTPTP
jgi:pentapeptide MXKDX repeat protein